jgi:hypothetical protein
MTPTALANYQNVLRPLLARLFNELMVASVSCGSKGGRFNPMARSHTFRQDVEVNSLSFFNQASQTTETIEVGLSRDRQLNPVITISGSDGTKVTLFSDGIPKADAENVRTELSNLTQSIRENVLRGKTSKS